MLTRCRITDPLLPIPGSSLYVFRRLGRRPFTDPFKPRLIRHLNWYVLFTVATMSPVPDIPSQGTGFCRTFEEFLAVRACFGIAMGGLYGNAAAMALEDVPAKARGLISGMLQQGYAFGYLLAVVFARGLVNTTPNGWRPLFWFG